MPQQGLGLEIVPILYLGFYFGDILGLGLGLVFGRGLGQ